MKKFGTIIMLIGFFIIFGTAGQSDYETLVLAKETTPFWQIQSLCFTGLTLLVTGAFLVKKK